MAVKDVWRLWGTAVGLALFLLLSTGSQRCPGPTPYQDEAPADQLHRRPDPPRQHDRARTGGQLFLVTFEGDQATFDSDIADLITNYHIGGVVLSASNDNITGYGDIANIPSQTSELINNLQSLALLGQPYPSQTAPELTKMLSHQPAPHSAIYTNSPLHCRGP